jgi:TP901 family phage tail tape measure protein
MPEDNKYIIRLIDRWSPAMKRIAKATQQFKERLKGMSLAVGGIGGIGGALAVAAIGRPLLAYQRSMNRVKAVSQANAEEMKRLDVEARRLGATTVFTTAEVAQGMAELAASGEDVNSIIALMPHVLNMAASGGISIEEAADSATDILQQFNMEAGDFVTVTDQMAVAASKCSAKMPQMINALRNTGKTANLAGIDFETVTAMLMALAEGGIKDAPAGTFLANMIRALVNPTKKSIRTFRRFGIDIKKFVEKGKIKDMLGLLDEMKSKNVDLGALFRILEIQGAKAAGVLIDSIPKVRSFIKVLHEADSEGGRMAKTMMEGLPGIIAEFQSAGEIAKLTLANEMLPVWTVLLNTFTLWSRKFSMASPAVVKWIGNAIMLGVALSALIVPLGLLAGAATFLFSSMGLIVAAVLLVAATMASIFIYRKKIAEFFGEKFRAVVDWVFVDTEPYPETPPVESTRKVEEGFAKFGKWFISPPGPTLDLYKFLFAPRDTTQEDLLKRTGAGLGGLGDISLEGQIRIVPAPGLAVEDATITPGGEDRGNNLAFVGM